MDRGSVQGAISGAQDQRRQTKWDPIRIDLKRGSLLNGIISTQTVRLYERNRVVYQGRRYLNNPVLGDEIFAQIHCTI